MGVAQADVRGKGNAFQLGNGAVVADDCGVDFFAAEKDVVPLAAVSCAQIRSYSNAGLECFAILIHINLLRELVLAGRFTFPGSRRLAFLFPVH